MRENALGIEAELQRRGSRGTEFAWMLVVVCLLHVALGCRAQEELHGTYDVSLAVDVQTFEIVLDTSLQLDVTIGAWTLASALEVRNGVWSSLDLDANGFLGPFGVETFLAFDPASASSAEWEMSADVEWGGISFEAELTAAPAQVDLVLAAEGRADGLDLAGSFGVTSVTTQCDLAFDLFEASLRGEFWCTGFAADLFISRDGFEEIYLEFDDTGIPNLPWLSLSADVIFTLDSQALTLSPSLDLLLPLCVDIYAELDTGPLPSVNGIRIYGLGVYLELPDWSFESLSYIDPTRWLKGEYWEMACLAYNADVRCGLLGFEATAYFLDNGAALFDLALVEVSGTISLSPSLTAGGGFVAHIEAGSMTSLILEIEKSW